MPWSISLWSIHCATEAKGNFAINLNRVMVLAVPLGPPVDLSSRPSWLKQAVQNITVLSFSKPLVLCWKHFHTTDIPVCSWLKTQPAHFPRDYTTKKCFFSFLKSLLSLAQPRESKRGVAATPTRKIPQCANANLILQKPHSSLWKVPFLCRSVSCAIQGLDFLLAWLLAVCTWVEETASWVSICSLPGFSFYSSRTKIPPAVTGFNAGTSTENIMHLPHSINHITSYINYTRGFSLVLSRPLGAMDYFEQ